jgi:drug/metabolite transporter (DMT)-like permease
MPHPLIWTYAKLVLTAVIWGGTFIAGRIAMQSMGPFTAAFWRFAIAATCLLLLSRQPRVAKHYPTLAQPLNRHQWGRHRFLSRSPIDPFPGGGGFKIGLAEEDL